MINSNNSFDNPTMKELFDRSKNESELRDNLLLAVQKSGMTDSEKHNHIQAIIYVFSKTSKLKQ